jgi:hypothetical protein
MRSLRRHTVLLLAVLGLAAVASPASSSARLPIVNPASMELVFAAETASRVGGEIAVPVECLGPTRGFCSGVLTLSHDGRRRSAPFSVAGGSTEPVFVPFRVEHHDRALKLRGVATTTQRPGAPTSNSTYLYAH